jgi:hypothetical protein
MGDRASVCIVLARIVFAGVFAGIVVAGILSPEWPV